MLVFFNNLISFWFMPKTPAEFLLRTFSSQMRLPQAAGPGPGYVAAFIDYHSYAEAMLPPWAYTAETPVGPDGVYQTQMTSFLNEAPAGEMVCAFWRVVRAVSKGTTRIGSPEFATFCSPLLTPINAILKRVFDRLNCLGKLNLLRSAIDFSHEGLAC